MPAGKSLRHEVVVGDLQERVHSRWLVGLAVGPGTYRGPTPGRPKRPAAGRSCCPAPSAHSDNSSPTASTSSPTFSTLKTRSDSWPDHQPIPEGRAEVETVVQVVGGNEDICVQKVGHQYPTPRLRPSSLNVDIFLRPSIRNVSVNEVRPSRVLTTIARAKRLLTRAPSVR